MNVAGNGEQPIADTVAENSSGLNMLIAAAAAAAAGGAGAGAGADADADEQPITNKVAKDSHSIKMLAKIIEVANGLEKNYDCSINNIVIVDNIIKGINSRIDLFDKMACINSDIPDGKKIDRKDKYYKMSKMLLTAFKKLQDKIRVKKPGDDCSKINDQVESLNTMIHIIHDIITHSNTNDENEDNTQFNEFVSTIEKIKQKPGVDKMITLVTAFYDLINNPVSIVTGLPKIASASGKLLALLQKNLLVRPKCGQHGGSFHKRTLRKTKKLNGIALDKIKNSVSSTDKTRKRIIKNFLKFTRKNIKSV
jgi:hypothetical protein